MKIAVSGLGSIGCRHIQNLKSLGYDSIVGHDSNRERAVQANLNITLANTADDINDPVVTFICTPPESHIDLATRAVARGSHIFIEKPLCLDMGDKWPSDLGYLVDGLLRNKSIIDFVACNMHFNIGPRQIKAWIEDGVLGEIIAARFECSSYLPDWHPGTDYKQSYTAKTGVILDVGSHEVDLALWLFGDARLVGAQQRAATSLGLGIDGAAELLLRHDSGVMSSISLSFIQQEYHRSIRVMGTRASAEWIWESGMCTVYGPENKVLLTHDYGQGLRDKINVANLQMFSDEIAYFMDCVENGKQTMNPVSQAVKVMNILLEAKHGN